MTRRGSCGASTRCCLPASIEPGRRAGVAVSKDAPDPAAAPGSGAASPSVPDAAASALLERCWELVSQHFLARAPDFCNEIAAAAARSGEDEQVRGARLLALHGKELAGQLRARLRAAFEASVAALSAAQPLPGASGAGLALVEIDESGLAGQVEQSATRLRHMVGDSAADLDLRLQTLLGGREVVLSTR